MWRTRNHLMKSCSIPWRQIQNRLRTLQPSPCLRGVRRSPIPNDTSCHVPICFAPVASGTIVLLSPFWSPRLFLSWQAQGIVLGCEWWRVPPCSEELMASTSKVRAPVKWIRKGTCAPVPRGPSRPGRWNSHWGWVFASRIGPGDPPWGKNGVGGWGFLGLARTWDDLETWNLFFYVPFTGLSKTQVFWRRKIHNYLGSHPDASSKSHKIGGLSLDHSNLADAGETFTCHMPIKSDHQEYMASTWFWSPLGFS